MLGTGNFHNFESGTTSVRIKSLLTLRWVAVIGQIATIAVVTYGLKFTLPLMALAPLVTASILLNFYLGWRMNGARITESELIFYLLFDAAQLTAMLYLTGGLQNPFAGMTLIYVTIAAVILSRRGAMIICGFTLFCLTLLAFVHDPLPWRNGGMLLDRLYSCGVWTSLVLATFFISTYIGNLVQEARQMSRALSATQQALAQEQRLSAMGSLAAATAHQLGSPLNTITLIAHDLLDQFDAKHPLHQDAKMLLEQSQHCKNVLTNLGEKAKSIAGQELESRLPLSAVVQMAIDDHKSAHANIECDLHLSYDIAGDPLIRLRPELLHSIGNILQNAMQHAVRNVVVEVDYDKQYLEILISDDGAGFAPELQPSLGEPYIQRQGKYSGMGLGIFIAKTLIEKMGGKISFHTPQDGGAEVTMTLPMDSLAPYAASRQSKAA